MHKLNRNEGVTIIHITHIMEEAVEADRIIVMEGGRKVMEGTPKEIFRQVEELKRYRLDVPAMADLAYRLRKAGISLPEDILTREDLAVALCP